MTFANLSSPNETRYIPYNKPSMPIEIPNRRQPAVNNTSPFERSTSPELIFEMSPVPSDFSPQSRYIFGLQESSPDMGTLEPFMYSFPVFKSKIGFTSGPRAQALRHTLCPVTDSPPILSTATTRQRGSSSFCLEDDGNLPVPLTCSSAKVTKITGFTPVTSASTQACSPLLSKTMRLSPPSRSPLYSSSPWILPGKSDTLDDESISIEADPSSFEFKRYLMRRMENKAPSRFHGPSLLSRFGDNCESACLN